MSNRKEFEAWYLDVWGCTEDNLDSLFDESPHGNEYYRFGVRLAWQAWQQATKQAESKYAALAADNEKAMEAMRQADSDVKLAHENFSALAAENAGLKDGVNKAIEDIQCFYDCYAWHVSEDGESETAVVALDDAKGSIEHFALSVKTPATDAFLAEVRAQGVEMYADNIDSGADNAERYGFDDAVKFLRSEASGVRLFAANLRKGVRS